MAKSGRDGSQKMFHIAQMVDKVSDTSLPVTITGESGTGKELIARAIHEGPRVPHWTFRRTQLWCSSGWARESDSSVTNAAHLPVPIAKSPGSLR